METYCQSCGMVMTEPGHYGTEADGSPSGEYCVHCYQQGAFAQDVDMEGMIELSLVHLEQWQAEYMPDQPKLTREQAKEMMMGFFPELKRWRESGD